MPEWKGLLLPASRGERPIIDSGRTPVAYSIAFFFWNCVPHMTDLRTLKDELKLRSTEPCSTRCYKYQLKDHLQYVTNTSVAEI